MSEFIGPVTPDEFLPKTAEPSLIGPTLPPEVIKSDPEPNPLKDSSPQTFGPQLPPHLIKKQHKETNEPPPSNSEKTIGPSLPPHLRKQLEDQGKKEDDSEEDESYGPLPAGHLSYSAAQIALEERALQMQIEKLGPGKNEPVRESWMTELPEAKAANFGLGPRQFRNRAAPDLSDRSSWTDVAGKEDKQKSKEKKVDLKAEAELMELEKRDKELESMSKKHKRKSKSLVDIHQEKIKKSEKSEAVTERKPFNREVDLQVNKFDDAQKKAILKKAQLLDDRFSAGKAKYL